MTVKKSLGTKLAIFPKLKEKDIRGQTKNQDICLGDNFVINHFFPISRCQKENEA